MVSKIQTRIRGKANSVNRREVKFFRILCVLPVPDISSWRVKAFFRSFDTYL